jgi:hypothetical protein
MSLEHLDTIIAFVAVITGISLLVTTLTQCVSAFLGLRGTNLFWGIKTLLVNADPALEKHATVIARQILHHPLISDSTLSGRSHDFFGRWKYASAIRKEELLQIVRMLGRPDDAEAHGSEAWRAALRNAMDRLVPAEGEKLMLVLPEIKKLFPDDPAKVELVMAQLIPTAERLTAELDGWFHSVMDRVSQRFAMHTRCWTIIFSVIVAFLLQLDAFKLFTTLSTDADLRARLTASANALTQKAGEILATPAGSGADLYISAMKQLIASNPDSFKGLPEPAGFSTLDGGEQWLMTQFGTAHPADLERWRQAYEGQVSRLTLQSAVQNLNATVKGQLAYQLLPDPYPSPIYRDWTFAKRALWGILASAALLSLGAPFWFNLLKTMSNLRPTLANKVTKERQDSEADNQS